MHLLNQHPNELLLAKLEPTIQRCVQWLIGGWDLSWDLAENIANKARAKIRMQGEKIRSNPEAFVKRVFRNAAVDLKRERKLRQLEEACEMAFPGAKSDDSIEDCKAQTWYRVLSSSEKEISDLLLEGWSRKEIREKLRISCEALRQRLHVIRRKIAPFFREAA